MTSSGSNGGAGGGQAPASRPSAILAVVVIAACLLAAVADGVRQSHWKAIHNPNDFVTLYAGSICMTRACNPYRVPDLETVLVEKRGTEIHQDWSDQLPIYPPTTLFLLLPFSLLPYVSAMTLWYTLNLSVYVAGLCWLFFFSSQRNNSPLWLRAILVLAGLHFPKMLQCLGFGNPSLMVTGLLLFAVFDDLPQLRPLRLFAAGVACLLKPPLAIPLAALMLLRQPGQRSKAWRPAAVLLALFPLLAAAAGFVPGMQHWRTDLSGNLSLGASGGMNPSIRGSASNVILNLANLPGYFTTNSHIIRVSSWAAFVVLTLILVVAVLRLWNSPVWASEGYLVSVAALAVLTLLPVYHRFCDVGVVLLVTPWVVAAWRRRCWQAWAATPLLLLLYVSWERRIPLERLHGALQPLLTFLYYRGDASIVLLLTCVLLSAVWSTGGRAQMAPAQE